MNTDPLESATSTMVDSFWMASGIAVALTYFGIKWVLYQTEKRAKEKILVECDAIIGKYSRHLGRERFSHGYTDAYGIRRYDKWEKKGRKYFLDKVLIEEHSLGDQILANPDIVTEILCRVEAVASDNEFSNNALANTSSGEEYEVHCEQILVANGWIVTRTPKSGDHGIDLIAERGGYRVCLQCKYYSSKVGNSAVQEASAGRRHYSGTHAGVVTNNSFTNKAIELAESNNVLLLHQTDLESLCTTLDKLKRRTSI